MKSPTHTFLSALVIVLAIFASPATSFAATTTTAQSSSTTQGLSTELSQLSAELSSGTPGVAVVTLSPGQSAVQSSTDAYGGILKMSVPAFAVVKPDQSATVKQPTLSLAELTLQYLPCVAASPTVCISEASSSYPAMTADLQSGQTTGYLNYIVQLTNLSSTTATFQVTDPTLFATLQNKINAIGAQITSLLGA